MFYSALAIELRQTDNASMTKVVFFISGREAVLTFCTVHSFSIGFINKIGKTINKTYVLFMISCFYVLNTFYHLGATWYGTYEET